MRTKDTITLEDVASLALPMLDETELLAELCDEIDAAGGQKAWATAHGVSAPYVHDILHRRRALSSEFARVMGHERLVVYVRTKPLDDEVAA